jgi:hypothetical protein
LRIQEIAAAGELDRIGPRATAAAGEAAGDRSAVDDGQVGANNARPAGTCGPGRCRRCSPCSRSSTCSAIAAGDRSTIGQCEAAADNLSADPARSPVATIARSATGGTVAASAASATVAANYREGVIYAAADDCAITAGAAATAGAA